MQMQVFLILQHNKKKIISILHTSSNKIVYLYTLHVLVLPLRQSFPSRPFFISVSLCVCVYLPCSSFSSRLRLWSSCSLSWVPWAECMLLGSSNSSRAPLSSSSCLRCSTPKPRDTRICSRSSHNSRAWDWIRDSILPRKRERMTFNKKPQDEVYRCWWWSWRWWWKLPGGRACLAASVQGFLSF